MITQYATGHTVHNTIISTETTITVKETYHKNRHSTYTLNLSLQTTGKTTMS